MISSLEQGVSLLLLASRITTKKKIWDVSSIVITLFEIEKTESIPATSQVLSPLRDFMARFLSHDKRLISNNEKHLGQ